MKTLMFLLKHDRCASYDGADGGAGTQQVLDHLVSVVQRLHQVLLLLRSLGHNKASISSSRGVGE